METISIKFGDQEIMQNAVKSLRQIQKDSSNSFVIAVPAIPQAIVQVHCSSKYVLFAAYFVIG